jgi:phospholipase C
MQNLHKTRREKREKNSAGYYSIEKMISDIAWSLAEKQLFNPYFCGLRGGRKTNGTQVVSVSILVNINYLNKAFAN